jgi:hypothetical protein
MFEVSALSLRRDVAKNFFEKAATEIFCPRV